MHIKIPKVLVEIYSSPLNDGCYTLVQ